jgi:hypothetical protein
MKGKSLMATLIGYVNSKYFDQFDVKNKFPKVYEMIHTGLVPEVEEIHVIDMDCSYAKLSKIGIFGELARPLYAENKIKVKLIKIPKRQVKYVNSVAKEAAKLDIEKAKLKVENTISQEVKDNHPGIALIPDSMSSYDEMLNDFFKIIFEEVLVKEDKKHLGASLKGVNQSYWKIRNGWWIETLRDKRTYAGWNIDTYKLIRKRTWKTKDEDEDDTQKIDDGLDYWVQWATNTAFDLDLVYKIDNDGTNYWAELKSRFEGGKPIQMSEKYPYTPKKRSAIFQILEGAAPYILGEVKDGEGKFKKILEADLW